MQPLKDSQLHSPAPLTNLLINDIKNLSNTLKPLSKSLYDVRPPLTLEQ